MRRAVAAVAFLPLALLATPAHAASQHEGECGFDTIQQDAATGPEFTGVVYAHTAVYGSGHDNVVNATVTCEIEVNDVVAASASGWGSGVVAFAAPVTYRAGDLDDVALCTMVDYTSDDTPTTRQCEYALPVDVVPRPVRTLVDLAAGVADYVVVAAVDPAACAVLPLLAPGTGPVTVEPGGDAYVAGELFWDCPPYRSPSDPPVTGAGYDTGNAGALLLTSDGGEVASSCGFVEAGGTIAVLGVTRAGGAASIRCVLKDQAGAILYDSTATGTSVAASTGTAVAPGGPVTVCTAGSGGEVTVGLACRRGEPLH